MKGSRLQVLMQSTRRSIQKNIQSALVVLGFFLLWEFAVWIFHIPQFILPAPSTALNHLFIPRADANYNWLYHISSTVLAVGLSFLVTSLAGILIASALAWSNRLKEIVLPAFVFINSLPIIAIAPIILLWMGYGVVTNIVIAFLVGFFPVVINTLTGLEAVEEDLLDLVRYLHASKLQIFIKIRIPNALPYIFSGLKICSTLSIMGAIVGEFIASDRGLGYIIINAQYSMNTPPIFSSLILISLAGALLYTLVALLERIIMPWKSLEAQP
ncbi:MAG TPA: ABC transporter permease [Spirochaetales bacterium]|nr:ABC transporter permease [Spirochaetales bacterium]